MANSKPTPGYRSPYFWLMLGPVMLSVVLGTTFLVASIVTWDGVVVDNYYKDGKSIEMRQEEDIAAQNLGLNALIVQQGEQFLVQVSGNLSNYPETLKLYFIHPTKSDFDQRIDLAYQSGNRYLASQPVASFTGERQLQLQPTQADTMWRLHGTMDEWPTNIPVNLSPAVWQ